MQMNEQATCGQGLAEHSTVPAKIAELIAALAENLEVHMTSLDVTDESSMKEHDAYASLSRQYRTIADELFGASREMLSYRDLPMGKHNEQAMAGPAVFAAFEKFVSVEQQLLAILQERTRQDCEMLDAFTGAAQ
jgi:hypothetical protein